MKGTFCWFDLSTPDPAAARAFYTTLFGWTTVEHRAGEMPHTMWKMGDQTFGGVTTLAEEAKKMGAPPHWMGYVWVDDVDAHVAKCSSLGGRVYVPGTDIPPNVGRFAILSDPHGAAFALYQSASPNPPGEWRSPVSWHECYTNELDSCWSFYERMFGWNKTDSMHMGDHGVYQMFGTGGRTMGGMMVKPPEMPGTAWLYYFHVDSADATAAKTKELGGSVIVGPMDIPGGDRIAICVDPQGASFAVHSNKK